MYADGGSMHVVEHYDDLFFWKKFNDYTHTLTLYKIQKGVGCYLNVAINYLFKHFDCWTGSVTKLIISKFIRHKV